MQILNCVVQLLYQILFKNASIDMGIIEKVENSSRTNLILFGIGLGYLFQLTAQKSKGLVILFEQDLRILKKAFSLVDFSAELSKKKVSSMQHVE